MNTPGAFGDYSYPIKLYEAMACGRPVVASRTASTAWVLRDFPDRLVGAQRFDGAGRCIGVGPGPWRGGLRSAAGLERVGRAAGGGDAADWRGCGGEG